MTTRAWSTAAAIVLMAGAAAHGGMGCNRLGEPEAEPVEQAASAAATCITIERGGMGDVADALINPVTPTKNYGASNSLSVGQAVGGTPRESLMRFDLSAIPPGVNIESAIATLSRLIVFDAQSQIDVHRVTAPWAESAVTYASHAGAHLSQVAASFPPGPITSADLTTLVRAWYDGSIPNHGVFLDRDYTGGTTFASSEATAGQRPRLDVCYTIPNHCSPDPCQNGGTCNDSPTGYTCSCPPGFTGQTCQVNTDDCAQNPCQNGGTCVDGANDYTCTCQPGFTGADCEINVDDCAPNPCQNGGACIDGVNGYTCACPMGFIGPNCQTNVDDCAGGPCQNGGTCTDAVNGYSCTCPPGFAGVNCEVDVDDCAGSPCQNGGLCVDGVNGYTCQCQAGFTGVNCEIDVDDCAQNPCQNGGTCVDGINAYTCQCPPGFTGVSCQINVDDCSPNPCQHGGTCTDGINAYTCACPPGYTGQRCEIDIDDCAGNPCQNGGTCVDGVNGYTCNCPPGYSGQNCQINTDDCASAPCQNGGVCVDGVNGYTCNCPPGYSGTNCEIVSNPPAPQIQSSATYAPSDGLAYATITVTPRNASGLPLGTGLTVEVMSNDPAVTLGGTGTSACTVNAPSATCLKAVDSGAGSYVITARSSTIRPTTTFTATFTSGSTTTTISETAQVTFDITKFQGGAGCAGACGTTVSSGTVTLSSANAGGRNLYITGGTVTFDASTVDQTLGDVFITGGTVTHLQGTNAAMFKLDVSANSWNFLGGTLDTSNKGYGKTCFTNGSCSGYGRLSFGANGAPSSSLAGPTDVYGASHGGMGSGLYRENFSNAPNTHSGNAGPTYDDYRDPKYPGATNSDYSAFHGGGVTRVTSAKTCVLAGAATVLASTSYNGAGGTINLRCNGITSTGWTGTLNADGGQGSGSSLPLGAGGGGRIALVTTGDAATITGAVSYPPSNITARVHAYGGAPGFLSSQHTVAGGGAGTIYIKHSKLAYGDLIVANNAPTHYPNEGTTRLPSIAGTISGNVAAGATAIPVTIASTMFNGTYYDNAGAPTITNPALSQNTTASTAAAYNGVFNGIWLRPSISANGGALFDTQNLVQVTANTAGSLATTAVPANVAQGTVFRSLDVLDHLDVTGHAILETNGDVYVLSGNVTNHGAAAMTLSGLALFDTTSGNTGRIQYGGGDVNVVQSGITTPPLGGGTLVADNVTLAGGSLQVPAIAATNAVTLTSGTIVTNAITAASYTQAAGTLKHYPPLFKTSPASAIVYALALNVSGSFALNGGSVDASGLGYPLAADPSGTPLTAYGYGATGPLAATGVSMGFGAGHGGTGGGYTAGAVRGMVYDDYRDPRYPGSAAATTGGSPTYLSWRSNGGGVVRIVAGGTCTLAGSTTVRATSVVNASQNFGASGGSVYMSCGGFNTAGWTGNVNVNGAAAYTQQSLGSTRAGAGGRIALVSNGGASSFTGALTYPVPTSTALLQARGGAGISATYTDGGAGTVFLKHSGVAYGQLLITNGGQTHYAAGGTTPLVSIAGTINGNVAAGATTIGVNITSAPLHGSASFNGLLRGMWLRPDTSVNSGNMLANNLVLVSNNAFSSSTLTNLTTTPALAAVASGAAFKSVDILDKYDVLGNAVVTTNGDIYILP